MQVCWQQILSGFIFWKCIHFHFWKIILLDIKFYFDHFFQYLKISFHCPLYFIVSDEKLTNILVIVLFMECLFFPLNIFKTFLFIFGFQEFDFYVPMCLCINPPWCLFLELLESVNLCLAPRTIKDTKGFFFSIQGMLEALQKRRKIEKLRQLLLCYQLITNFTTNSWRDAGQ